MSSWADDAVFYHLFPLGALGAPARNDFTAPPVPRLDALHAWLDPMGELGTTALLLGPVLESGTHGYDTADLARVDRRLGTRTELARFSAALHARGMRLVLDAVFHHVGRDFWAFRDVLAHPDTSPYRGWFHLDPRRRSPYGDPFAYEGWNGHHDLVKLDVGHPAVREHLLAAARDWIEAFDLDGLRLDAADVLDRGFQRELATLCRGLRRDFWLLGEVVHGDYNRWAGPGGGPGGAGLDAVTNYEVHKALHSCHNDRNYFELAHALDRQRGPFGIYPAVGLYNFADNHDVERVASRLENPGHLYPLHALLFTLPGTPALYYGSEVGLEGRKTAGSDAPLRPALDPASLATAGRAPDLRRAIARFAAVRRAHPALRRGTYATLHTAPEQLAFARATPEELVIVATNAASQAAAIRITLPDRRAGRLVDALDAGPSLPVPAGGAVVVEVPSCWARVLRWEPLAS